MICADCHGSGHDELGFLDPVCGTCGGSGSISRLQNIIAHIPAIITLPVRHKGGPGKAERLRRKFEKEVAQLRRDVV